MKYKKRSSTILIGLSPHIDRRNSDSCMIRNRFHIMSTDQPSATLAPLERADGSASFSSNGYSVIGAVNGPIDVQRRDELPEEAAVDVVIRPASGVGGKFHSKIAYTRHFTD